VLDVEGAADAEAADAVDDGATGAGAGADGSGKSMLRISLGCEPLPAPAAMELLGTIRLVPLCRAPAAPAPWPVAGSVMCVAGNAVSAAVAGE
jgi:hypothetical protein